ncbi:sensor histidine kinase [Runella salmonicolor]|uniref:histidine kinase n=1 Tax=Runella salmonicolor TaxID=2950278 RepID=A0ABT1FXP5_9BACT|nr:7TM diverse intracellular signaling domain-containing protein [Runella salmonicolor]MCP1386240.1 ATP-binding protein [Runella salmonicolor]
MFRSIAFLLALISFYHLRAQRLVKITEQTQQVSLAGHLAYEVDYQKNQRFEQIIKIFKPQPVIHNHPNFGNSPHPHWVRFGVHYTGMNPKRLSLITKGIDSLEVYVTDSRFHALKSYRTGSHYPMRQREISSAFLTTSFEVLPDSIYWIWTKMHNVHYRLAASPFILYSQEAGRTYISIQQFYHSIYIGSMALFLLLGVALAYFFREKIYWYYLGCIVCALCIMLIYNDYGYLFFERLPIFILNKNALGVLSATVPVFYLLFAEQFLEVSRQVFLKTYQISRIVIILQYSCMAVLMFFQQTLFEYKPLFYVFMGILSTINLVYLLAKWPSPAAKLFVGATLPVTITVLIETFSDVHQWPVQHIHNAYYFTTLIELLVLTGGIVYRFKKNEEAKFRLEEAKYKLEEEKYRLENEILKIEFNTQRRERNQIADEMHNELGSLLAASKFQVGVLAKEYPETKWEDIKEQLSEAYLRIRDISYQLRTNDDDTLQSVLINKYKRINIVDFSFDNLQSVRFDPFIEAQLSGIISELITNALKHAQCSSIMVQISYDQPQLSILIEDDGRGFDLKTSLKQNKKSGLTNIEKQITQNMKGQFTIDSGPRGTTIIIKVNLLPHPL